MNYFRMREWYIYIYYMKICYKCGLNKSYDSFYKRKTNDDGYRNTCKVCESLSKKKSQKKYIEKNSGL